MPAINVETPRDPCPADALRGWLFFRHEEDRHLWCAVVHGHTLPGFVLAGAWRAQPRESAAAAIGTFRQAQARQGIDLNGFYLFHALCGGLRRATPEARPRPTQAGDWTDRAAAPCLRAA